MFDIRVERLMTDAEAASVGGDAFGRITAGDLDERFYMSLKYWAPEDYHNHWLAALTHVNASADATSCLVSSMSHPAESDVIFCWPLFRDGDTVHVQNRILFLEELDAPLDLDQPWKALGARQTVSEDGDAISEWVTTIDEIRDCLQQLRAPGQ